MPYADRQKRLEYSRRWNKANYQNNTISEKERIRKRKREIASWFKNYKQSLKCVICGENTPICLDFHHRAGEHKDFVLGRAKNWGWGKRRILEEVAKCVVLCSNCHRKVHEGIIRL